MDMIAEFSSGGSNNNGNNNSSNSNSSNGNNLVWENTISTETADTTSPMGDTTINGTGAQVVEAYQSRSDLDNSIRGNHSDSFSRINTELFAERVFNGPDNNRSGRSSTPRISEEEDNPRREQTIRKRSLEEAANQSSLAGLEFNLVVPLVTLSDKVDENTINAFREQSRARPTLKTKDVVQGLAREHIALRLRGDTTFPFLAKKDILTWYDHVNITQAAEMVSKYFSAAATKSELPIADTLMKIRFRLKFSNEAVEDETFLSMIEALNKHDSTHPQENDTTLNELANLIERRLPPNSQLHSDYLVAKKAEIAPGETDTPLGVIYRIKGCMGDVRRKRREVDRYGDFNFEYVHEARGGGKAEAQTLPPIRPEDNPQCRTCGHHGHIPAQCTYKNCPDVNASITPWADSDIGRQWKRFGHDYYHPHATLPLGEKAAHTEGFRTYAKADAALTEKLRGNNPDNGRHCFDSQGARIADEEACTLD